MKIIEKNLQIKSTYDISRWFTGQNPLFIDIETTGLSPERSHTYLIGCIRPLEDGSWQFIQWLAESPFEERQILDEAASFIRDFSPLVHFNGDRFDLPYLQYRCEEKGIEAEFTRKESFDLYKQIKKCKSLCSLINGKQKTIEAFLGIDREDQYDGGRLIPVYHQYVKEGGDDLLHLLLIHNEEDVIGMTKLLPMLEYVDLLCGCGDILAGLPEMIGNDQKIPDTKGASFTNVGELLLSFPLIHEYPSQASFLKDGWYGVIKGHSLRLKVPVYYGELKYFFPNPKDYYYLPAEDMAVHKSVAEYVDKAYRRKATAENCYIRKSGCFIPLAEREKPCKKAVKSHKAGNTPASISGCAETRPQIFREMPAGQGFCEWKKELIEDIRFWEMYLRNLIQNL